MRNADTYTRYAQHQKYGEVVRTGPDELCFANAAPIKDIYGQSSDPCLKAPWFYDGFTLTSTSSVFSERDRHLHARMRRLLSSGFSQQGVLHFEDEVVAIFEKLQSILSSASQPVNFNDPLHDLFLDTTSQLSFGKPFNLLGGEGSQGSTDIETYFNIAPLFGRFPLAKYLPFGIFQAARAARLRIIDFSQSCINDLRARLRQGAAQKTLLRHMVEAKEETGTAFSDAGLIENAVLFIKAGSHTTSSTLICLIYELGRRSEMKARLEQEIRDTFPDNGRVPDFQIASELVSLIPTERHSLAPYCTPEHYVLITNFPHTKALPQ